MLMGNHHLIFITSILQVYSFYYKFIVNVS